MGQRYAGCLANTSSSGAIMGPSMMGGYYNQGGWSSMMGSRDYSWITGGAWRTMSRQDWQRLQRQWLGTSAGSRGHHSWSAWTIVRVTLAAVLLITLAGFALIHRPLKRHPPVPTPSEPADRLVPTSGSDRQELVGPERPVGELVER